MITLPSLPFEPKALEPYISEQTVNIHYGKHHQAYVDNTNKLIAGTDFEGLSLEEIIKKSFQDLARYQPIFNNAAQVWNHTFYWNSLSPQETAPSQALKSKIEEDFGSIEAFKEAFANAAVSQFGSGWAWLVKAGDRLEVRQSSNAHTPLVEEGVTPLLTIDVWEHAYYLDVQNRRPEYVDKVISHLLNWDFASKNFAA